MTRFLLLVCCCGAALGQDERRVVSPDGRVEFRLFIASQPDSTLSRIAYQVWYRGKVLVDTSRMGFDLYEQEPLLGENIGMTSAAEGRGSGFRWLVAHYMQNGSLGRLLDVEARVYDDGVAFRYVIAKSTPVERLTITDESTEFALAHEAGAALGMPFVAERRGVGWASIRETAKAGYPAMSLAEEDGDHVLLSRLRRAGGTPDVVFDGKPPLESPWRVIGVGPDRGAVERADWAGRLR